MRLLAATRFVLLPLLAATASTLLAACGNGAREEAQQGPTPALNEANLTVDEVYARFAQAITRPGFIYRVTIDLSYDGAYSFMEGTRTSWIDAGRDLAREEEDTTIRSQEQSSHDNWSLIIANGGQYRPPQPTEGEPGTRVKAPMCHGANAAVSAVLGCPGPTDDVTEKAEIGKYKGHAVVVLTTDGTVHGEDETIRMTEKLYLDRRTLLPIASETESTVNETYDIGCQMTYKNDFVPVTSLPDDFFDPASIGYVETDPEAQLNADLGFTVYWLGRSFGGETGLPSLTLTDVGSRSRNPFMLNYRPANDEFGPAILSLDEYDVNGWRASQAFPPLPGATPVPIDNWWERPCKDMALPTGHATLVLDIENETENRQPPIISGERACIFTHDGFFALVFLGSTVIRVNAPLALDDQGVWSQSPYNSLEGMEAVVRALQPRQ